MPRGVGPSGPLTLERSRAGMTIDQKSIVAPRQVLRSPLREGHSERYERYERYERFERSDRSGVGGGGWTPLPPTTPLTSRRRRSPSSRNGGIVLGRRREDSFDSVRSLGGASGMSERSSSQRDHSSQQGSGVSVDGQRKFSTKKQNKGVGLVVSSGGWREN